VDDRSSGLLPYTVGIGALVALAGGFGMLAFAGLNLAHAVGGDAESPELNVAFGPNAAFGCSSASRRSRFFAWPRSQDGGRGACFGHRALDDQNLPLKRNTR